MMYLLNPFSKNENNFKHRKGLHILEAILCFFYDNIKTRKDSKRKD
jgi:hypothetical protein